MNIKGLYETGVNSLAGQLSVISTLTTKDVQATMWTYDLIRTYFIRWPLARVQGAGRISQPCGQFSPPFVSPQPTPHTFHPVAAAALTAAI